MTGPENYILLTPPNLMTMKEVYVNDKVVSVAVCKTLLQTFSWVQMTQSYADDYEVVLCLAWRAPLHWNANLLGVVPHTEFGPAEDEGERIVLIWFVRGR